MAGGIFISYRRDDAKHAAGRLVDRLVASVGRDKLFMDVDNIEPGLDFVKVLHDEVAKCDVLLALIGPDWLDARDKGGARRLDNLGDFVRIEIEAALARDIRVVPVLLDGAELPAPEAVPVSLQPLLRRHAVRLSHERFGDEADRLAASLKRAIGLAEVPVQKPIPANWIASFAKPPAPSSQTTSRLRPPSPSFAYEGLSAPIPSRRPILFAVAFAALAFPSVFGTVGFFSSYELNLSGSNNPRVGAGFSGSLLFAVLASLIAFINLRRRGEALTGSELAFYWFGLSVAIGIFMGPFFCLFTQSVDDGLFRGWLVGAFLGVLSGIALLVWWKRREDSTRSAPGTKNVTI